MEAKMKFTSLALLTSVFTATSVLACEPMCGSLGMGKDTCVKMCNMNPQECAMDCNITMGAGYEDKCADMCRDASPQ